MTTTETLPRITSTKSKNKHGDTRGLHPNSLGNLKPIPFLPGNNGGPGRPISDRAREKLAEDCPFDSQGRKWKEVLPEAMLRQALSRTEGMRELLDRVEGKVPGDQPPVTNINVVFVIGKGYRDTSQLIEGKE